MKETVDYTERAARLFCVSLYALGAYVLLKYFLWAILPPTVAFCISWGVSELSKKLSGRTGIPQGVWAFLTVSAMLALCAFIVWYVCRLLVTQIANLAQSVSLSGASVFEPIFSALGDIPIMQRLVYTSEEYAREELTPLVSNLLFSFSSVLGGVLSRALRATPTALLGGFVTLMSVYYMSVDFDNVRAFIVRVLPVSARENVSRLKSSALYVGVRYIRAYALIFLVTFCELCIGLLILFPSYAVICALGIAVLDILPVFGAGLVLIPWGVVRLLQGDVFMGVGLLILYGIVTVIRQLIEPRIVGANIGLHPLGAMLAMFIGYKALGVVGMLTAPMVLSMLLAYVGENARNKNRGI